MNKEKEWLKDKIKDEEYNLKYVYDNYVPYENVLIADDVYDLIDQLDEPKITEEQAWNKIAESYPADAKSLAVAFEHFYYEGFAKKKLPVIPQFIADWIEKWKYEGLAMREWFTFDYDNEEDDEVAKWLYDNDYEENTRREYLLIDAIRYGYEVEKEKKYYVDLDMAAYVAKWNGDNQVGIYTDGISGSDEFEFYLTEKEIKDYDARFWAFAEEVTE